MMQPTPTTRFKDFVDSLRIDFNTKDSIPIVDSDDDWKRIGNIIATSPSFARNSIPTTENFLIWQNWGIIIYGLMAR